MSDTQQIIIHVDMDAFYASVEVRDNPALKGRPLIIGSLPRERGVVATCSYEARKFGVHSAMNIKEAYRRCPNGIYMHPNFEKYRAVSDQLHGIWNTYASASETVALDEEGRLLGTGLRVRAGNQAPHPGGGGAHLLGGRGLLENRGEDGQRGEEAGRLL